MGLVARLKADAETRHLPTIATTTDDPAAVAAYALALGADDIFALPVEDTELYARTPRALAPRHAGGGAAPARERAR